MTKRIEHRITNNVEEKYCSKCEQWKRLSDFNKNKQTWDKLRHRCKMCKQKDNKDRKEYIQKYNKKYWKQTKEQQTIKHKKWYKDNKEHMQKYNKEYREKNLEKIREQDRKYNEKRRKDPKYRKWYNEYRKEYDKQKRKTNINFKLKKNISRRIREMLKQNKSDITIQYCGCSLKQLKVHLEARFTDGMTWNNYGNLWHIDHIIPCNAWDLVNKFEIVCCFNFRNLQPMWGGENISKRDMYDAEDKKKYKLLIKDILS